MIGEILVKTLTCLLMSPLFLAYWRGMINLIYLFIYIYIYNDNDDDEIWFIRYRYKVMTLLVSAHKINNTNKIQQPQ